MLKSPLLCKFKILKIKSVLLTTNFAKVSSFHLPTIKKRQYQFPAVVLFFARLFQKKVF